MDTTELKKRFEQYFGRPAAFLFSAPGRTELGGNHTDHQHGKVLAAAVTLDMKACVAPNDLGKIRIDSEGFPSYEVDCSDLCIHPEEKGSSPAFVRGVAAGFAERGYSVCGFDASITSDVWPGGGCSSSAAFEVLISVILNHLCAKDQLSPLDLALISQYAENVYYGKPSGLMDQMACACGGIVNIDFKDPSHPEVIRPDYDFAGSGYQLCIIDSGADHQNLTHEYAAIPEELGKLCGFFGEKWLRDVPEEEFFRHIPELKALTGDRAILRAIHVYEENRRVDREVDALQKGDFEAYLQEVRESGASSWQYLQNVIPSGSTVHQEMALTLAVVTRLLNGRGASRVQGGGFAGTIQAYVPTEQMKEFTEKLEAVFGKGKCTPVSTRQEGGCLEQIY